MRITTTASGQLCLVCREATITVSLLSLLALGIIIAISRAGGAHHIGAYALIGILVLTIISFYKLADWRIVLDRRRGRVDYYRKGLLRSAEVHHFPLTDLESVDIERSDDGTSRLRFCFHNQQLAPSQVYTGNNKLQIKDQIDEFLATGECGKSDNALLASSRD